MAKKDDWNMLSVIKKAAKKSPPPDDVSPEIIEEIFKILQQHQYRTNRERPRNEIKRLIELYERGGK